MGSKPGPILRFFIGFATVTNRQIDRDLIRTFVAFAGGCMYGSWKGGNLKSIETERKIMAERRDYERQQQLLTAKKMAYEAKAREVEGTLEAAN